MTERIPLLHFLNPLFISQLCARFIQEDKRIESLPCRFPAPIRAIYWMRAKQCHAYRCTSPPSPARHAAWRIVLRIMASVKQGVLFRAVYRASQSLGGLGPLSPCAQRQFCKRATPFHDPGPGGFSNFMQGGFEGKNRLPDV